MKLSVSLSESDVAILDQYIKATGLRSRSAALQQAVRRLRHETLARDYAEAWDEWDASGDRDVWDAAAGDGIAHGGLGDAAR